MGVEATQRHYRDDLSIIGGGGVILVEHGAMDNARRRQDCFSSTSPKRPPVRILRLEKPPHGSMTTFRTKRVSPFFLSFFSYVRHIRRRQKVVLTCLRPITVFSALHDRQRRAAPLHTGASMKKKKVGTYGRE
jgi:hypothetical protein